MPCLSDELNYQIIKNVQLFNHCSCSKIAPNIFLISDAIIPRVQ